jgi:hypothetical protein
MRLPSLAQQLMLATRGQQRPIDIASTG